MGIGGASWKTDRSFQLDAMTKMRNVFNFALPQAESSQAAGQDSLGKAGDYWGKILSGNRSAVSAAVAPETNAIRSGADARKRQLSQMGTARGGGVNATSQQLDTDTAAKTDNAIFAARPEAAKETASIGRTELANSSSLLSEAGKVSTDLASISGEARKNDYQLNQDMVGKVSTAIDNALTAIFA